MTTWFNYKVLLLCGLQRAERATDRKSIEHDYYIPTCHIQH